MAIYGYDWTKTAVLAKELNLPVLQLHLNQFESLSVFNKILNDFNDVYLHLPPVVDFKHPLISNPDYLTSISALIQHDQYFDDTHIKYFQKNRIKPGFENDRENEIDTYIKRLKKIHFSGLALTAVLDCPRFYHQYHTVFLPDQILNRIIHNFIWCKNHNLEIVLHVIDVKDFTPDKSNWVSIFNGILPWEKILSFIIAESIPVRSIIFEYEDIDMTENSVYCLKQWLNKY